MINTKKSIRWGVFAIPFCLTIAVIILNIVNGDAFNAAIMSITDFILDDFSWLFSIVVFACVILVILAYVSPFGKVRIGGRNAVPMLKLSDYIWIVMCTIMAAGILLWACAEPLIHYYSPPSSVEAESPAALQFAMKNLFLEWSFTPMCLYGLPAILFAFLFYNAKKKFSVGSMLYPCLKDNVIEKVSPAVDVICLLALVCGMAASMGSAVFLLSDGVSFLSNGGIASDPKIWIIVGVIIVAAFVTSAVTGVLKGIRFLSTTNAWIYLSLGLFVFLAGPTFYILNLTTESFGAYLSDFCRMNLFLSAGDGDKWAMWWPVFYWCNWMAWLPITATFLGKISKGYTIREAIRVLIVYPSAFSILWLGIFSSTAVYYELSGVGVYAASQNIGPAYATYTVLEQLPLTVLMIVVFLIIVFISFVTASDSNTSAMSSLCTGGLSDEDSESPTWLKIVWGTLIGATCLVFLIAFRSTDAIKYLSNLGGFPVVFLMLFFLGSFIKIMKNPKKYDVHKEDYDEDGNPIPSERLKAEY